MRRLLLLPIVLPMASLGACAPSRDSWPSLAPRPGEQLSLADAVPAAPLPGTTAVRDIDARLATVERDLDALTARWKLQDVATAKAVGAAKGSATSSEAWSAAQLELSRLEQLGNQQGELRGRTDAIAGDLALAASRGSETGTAAARAGALIARIETLRADHDRSFAAANAALPRSPNPAALPR